MASCSSFLVRSSALSMLLLLLQVTPPGAATELPAPIERCHRTDEKCIVEQTNRFIRAHPHGLAALGLPDMEPLHLDDLNILGDERSAATFNLHLTEVYFHNYSSLVVDKLRGFAKDTSKPMKVALHLSVPLMTMRAKYRITGKILVLPITGEGDLEWVITDSQAKALVRGLAEERDGKTYLKIDDYKLMSKSKNVRVHMTNLFNGDPALSENMLQLLNENWELLSADIQPQIDRALARQYGAFLTNFFGGVPYEDIFLPDD